MRTNKKIATGLIIASFLLPAFAFAAQQSADEKAGNYNMILISLVCLMLVLLFAIGILANILRQLAFVLRDKNRKDRAASNIVKTVLLFLLFSIQALHTFAMEVSSGKAATGAADVFYGIPAN